MVPFIVCTDAKLAGVASDRFCCPIIDFILNNASFHVFNNTMASLLIKSSNQFPVVYADSDPDFVAVRRRTFHASYRVNRDMIKVCNFAYDTFHLVLFLFQLHCVALMLELASATFIKHIARRFHAFRTWFLYFK